MVREHAMSEMPSGVAAICADWFDEFCPAGDAVAVAEMAAVAQPYFNETVIGGALIWLKSRLLERGVLRALARELNKPDGGDYRYFESEGQEAMRLPPRELTPEELQQQIWKMKWAAPAHLGYASSQISKSPLVLRAINRTADRVCHFENDTPCPYCRRRFRNGAALRLHVIDFHLHEYQE